MNLRKDHYRFLRRPCHRGLSGAEKVVSGRRGTGGFRAAPGRFPLPLPEAGVSPRFSRSRGGPAELYLFPP